MTPRAPGLEDVATRIATSDELGWQDVHAGVWEENPVVENLEILPGPGHRLVMVTNGRYLIESRSGSRWQRALQTPGALGLTPAGKTDTVRWRSATTERLRSVHVHLSVDTVDEARRAFSVRGSLAFPDVLQVVDPGVQSTVRDIVWALEAAASPLYADALGHILVAKLVTGAWPAKAGRAASPGLDGPVLVRVVEYLEANLSRSITLADLSAVANLSKHHFLRQFTVSTGQTPHRFLRRMRMERAQQLLADGNRTIGSIAHICGYASDRRFSSAFSRHTGLSPARWRASRAGG